MIKKILLISVLLLGTYAQAQDKKKLLPEDKERKKKSVKENNALTNSLISNQAFSEFINGGTPGSNTPFTVISRKKEVEGNKFLNKDWNNSITITNKKEEKVVLNNANFDLQIGTFALATEESIYLLDVIRYKEIIFNNKTFLNTYNPINKSRRYLEVIYSSNNIKILKEYILIKKETESVGGYIKGKIKYIKKSNYYYSADNQFKKINLKKSEILKLFGQKSSELSSFIKDKKLSFKKEEDIKIMFDHYSNL